MRGGIASFFPAYFALVMATGIASVAAFLLGLKPIAYVLLALNIVHFCVLSTIVLLRVVFYFSSVLADLRDHTRGPGFFSVVAGMCVFGSQLVVLTGAYAVATGLWAAGIVLWVLVMYSFFGSVVTRERKPSLEAGINGAWLIAAVATQSLSTLGSFLAPHFGYQPVMMFVSLCAYLLGCMLYLNIITLIFYRFTFLEFTAQSFTPPYWINMGAVAITTLSGSLLILNSDHWQLLIELKAFVKGFTLFFWVAGTWWIPLLFVLGVWRHVYKRDPITYDPQYWGLVFPLGMYTTSTFRLSQALELPFLLVIPRVFLYISLAAWLATYLGMIRSVVRYLRGTDVVKFANADTPVRPT
ncbi:MAG: tellurite resistance/C4-dicarboxylate transporter family protein [Vicinamibacteria bacterium]